VVVVVVGDTALSDVARVSFECRWENEPSRREVREVRDDVDGALDAGFEMDF
jgi:hypothetical protein